MKTLSDFFKALFRRRPSHGDPVPEGGAEIRSGGPRKAIRRRWAWLFGILAVLCAAHAGTSGLRWSTYFHPDEVLIRQWIDQVRQEGAITGRVYPSGWFELFRIRFWFEKNVPKWTDAWAKHATQDGRVAAISLGTFKPRGETWTPERDRHQIQDGRDFNAWLYVLTVLFLYAACLEAGFHPLAAFVSALFFVASEWPLEFVHYCETDTALLVSMAFFAWLAARAIRKRSLFLALAASFAAGFAVSCKFSLAPLLLWCLVFPAAVRPPSGKPLSRRLPAALLLALAAAALAAGGYLWGSPLLRQDPQRYMELLQLAKRSTYNEILRDLGGRYTWSGAVVLRSSSLVRHLSEMGLLPFLWGMFSWTFWFVPRFRRQLAGVPWLLIVFFPFWVFSCPFVRRQELLPLNVLFSMGAALPLQWWLSRPEGSPPLRRTGRAAAAAAALLGAAAFLVQFSRAAAMNSCFRLRDTRAEAQNWLRTSIPEKVPMAFDAYVKQIDRGVDTDITAFSGLPYRWQGAPPESGGATPLYYVENVGFTGRLPIRNPRTGFLYPRVRESVAAYNASVFPVKTWAVSRSSPLPTFGQPRVRLVSFDLPPPTAFDVPIGFSRPILSLEDGVHLYDAAGPSGPGPVRAIHTVGKRSSVHFNVEDGPRWLVTRMLKGREPARIVREGFFRPASSELAAGGAVAGRLLPTFRERLSARAAARSTMQCRMRGDDQNVFCASYLVSSAAEAARELRTAGNPAAALELLRAEKELDAAARVEAFWSAALLGETPEPAWRDAAENALAAAGRLRAERRTLGRAGATLCGVPLGVLDDFARVKSNKFLVEPGAEFPLWLPPGRYTIAISVRPQDRPLVPPRLFETQSADFLDGQTPGGQDFLSAPLEVGTGQYLRVARAGDPEAFEPFGCNLELSWSPVDSTLDAAESLRPLLDGKFPASAAEAGGVP